MAFSKTWILTAVLATLCSCQAEGTYQPTSQPVAHSETTPSQPEAIKTKGKTIQPLPKEDDRARAVEDNDREPSLNEAYRDNTIVKKPISNGNRRANALQTKVKKAAPKSKLPDFMRCGAPSMRKMGRRRLRIWDGMNREQVNRCLGKPKGAVSDDHWNYVIPGDCYWRETIEIEFEKDRVKRAFQEKRATGDHCEY